MVIFVIDSSEEPGRGDEYIMNFLVSNQTEFIVALNKWDLVDEEFRNLRLEQYKKLFGSSRDYQIISASKGEGCSELLSRIFNFLPTGPKLYEEGTISDQPIENLISDFVREQILINTREEVPHSVAVKIEKIQEMKRKNGKIFTAILAIIIVERTSQKGILIGKKGAMLKNIGRNARSNISKLIGGQVHLELFVKVVPNWRKRESRLIEFGYEEDI